MGTPFLISPGLEYDVELNRFFYSADMLGCRDATRLGYARDLAAFLSFLHRSRGGRGWRDATEDDHTAYLVWRLYDSSGPRVSGGTWDREVSGVNRFYRWQAARGNVAGNPVPQRPRRRGPAGVSDRAPADGAETPATYTHGARAERICWFPAASYRQWRDIGVRGYGRDGLADPGFRGRWAARNAVFCDLMVRTGLRLAEQSWLTVFEVPLDRSIAGYVRFWLAPAIAKGGSGRWVYVPASVVRDLAAYAQIDRRDVIASARARGRYASTGEPVLVADGDRRVAREYGAGRGETVKISQLSAGERRRLFVEGPGGLEPAAFWLSEDGRPVSPPAWKNMFAKANTRCARHGVELHAHAHLLRHTFAVLTLEQMQRGHIAALAELNPELRRMRQLGGHLPSAARTNTMPVLFSNYLRGDQTTIDWAQKVVSEAFADVEQSALAAHRRALEASGRATLEVVPAGHPARAPSDAGLKAVTARRAAAGDLDTAWAACRDHEHHPLTGKRCGASFLDCFHCANCLITHAHLPRLLSLLDAFEARRPQMSGEAWWTRYGPAWAAIRFDVLPKFSQAELDQACSVKPHDSLLDLVEPRWEHP